MSDAGDFLFTWNPAKWPHEELRLYIDEFKANGTVTVSWRCQAHRQVRAGSGAYLYKQGDPPNGIFGIAKATTSAIRRSVVQQGEAEYEVPLRFELLVDPTEDRFIMTKEQLQVLPEKVNLNTPASGIALPSLIARAIDAIAADESHDLSRSTAEASTSGPLSAAKRERLAEVYARDQRVVDELKRLYGGRCQICDSVPFNGLFGNIAEGHHIEWLCRGGGDVRENVALLCPNHHAAVHAADPTFDWGKLTFQFGTKPVPIRVNKHLRERSLE